MKEQTDAFTATVTVNRLFVEGQKMHGYATTSSGETVYIPSRLVKGLREGIVVEAKLKPSIDARAKWFLAEICVGKQQNKQNRNRGMVIYDQGAFNGLHNSQGDS